MKKIFSFALAVLFLIAMCPAAFAQRTDTKRYAQCYGYDRECALHIYAINIDGLLSYSIDVTFDDEKITPESREDTAALLQKNIEYKTDKVIEYTENFEEDGNTLHYSLSFAEPVGKLEDPGSNHCLLMMYFDAVSEFRGLSFKINAVMNYCDGSKEELIIPADFPDVKNIEAEITGGQRQWSILHRYAEEYLGDADGDGSVTPADARQILRFSVDLETPDERQKYICDIANNDGITAADARLALRMSVNLEDLFKFKNGYHIHSMDSEQMEIVESTCTQPGYEKGKCITCGKQIQEVIEPLGHTTRLGFCDRCGEHQTQLEDALIAVDTLIGEAIQCKSVAVQKFNAYMADEQYEKAYKEFPNVAAGYKKAQKKLKEAFDMVSGPDYAPEFNAIQDAISDMMNGLDTIVSARYPEYYDFAERFPYHAESSDIAFYTALELYIEAVYALGYSYE